VAAIATSRPQPTGPGQVRGLAHLAPGLTTVSTGLLAFNLAYYAGAWALALGAIALFWAHPAWYTFALAFLVVSSRQQAILNCEHECTHRKFVRGRRANDLVGTWLTGAPVGSPFGAAQARHLAHHRLLGTAGDPDHVLHDAAPPRDTRLGLVRHFARGVLGAYAVMILFERKDESTPRSTTTVRDLLAIVTVQALLWAAMTVAFDWWVYLALWVAPLATLTTFTHLLRSYAEHAITPDETPGHANRLITIRSNPLERALVSPYWMNLHAEHHLLPSVPAPRLRRLRRRLAGEPALPPLLERPSYAAALRRCLGGLRP
jgi:fatty acid desaturase